MVKCHSLNWLVFVYYYIVVFVVICPCYVLFQNLPLQKYIDEGTLWGTFLKNHRISFNYNTAERLVKEEGHNNVGVVPLWTDVLIVSADV